MKKYPLYELGSNEFENLVASLCHCVLGTGTVCFSTGKDGGRDAVFRGTANNFPSSTNPWNGTFIIQAKHTTKIDMNCSDGKFNAILRGEKPKIYRMIKQGELDYYLLFTNYKLSALEENNILNELESPLKERFRLIANRLFSRGYKSTPKLSKLVLLINYYFNLCHFTKRT